VHLVKRGDHTLTIKFAVPAAYYHRGAGVVVRLTRGKKPAARPSAGYAVAVYPDHEAYAHPTLAANVPYTFAIWIHDGGKYSKRVVFRTRTAKDTTPPDTVTGLRSAAGISGDGTPRVILDWTNPCCDEIASTRIVRNTKPTTTGGTVFNVPAGARSWVDEGFGQRTADGYSSSPLYYFVIPRDKAGHFARFYTSTSVVVGSRTISGSVSREDRYVEVFSCCNIQGGSEGLVTKEHLSGSVNGGAFSFTLPPGRYTVCESAESSDGTDPTDSCWIPDTGGGGHTVTWRHEFEEDYPPGPNIDLTSQTSYSGIAF
jgi:hypothetical protein